MKTKQTHAPNSTAEASSVPNNLNNNVKMRKGAKTCHQWRLENIYAKWLECNFSRVGFTMSYYSLNKQTDLVLHNVVCIFFPSRSRAIYHRKSSGFAFKYLSSFSISSHTVSHGLFIMFALINLHRVPINLVSLRIVNSTAHHYAPVSCCLTFEFFAITTTAVAVTVAITATAAKWSFISKFSKIRWQKKLSIWFI